MPAYPPAAAAVLAQIVSWWRELLGAETVGDGDDFFDLGGTSLTLIRLAAMVEETFGVALPMDELLTRALTPAAIVAAIAGGGEERALLAVERLP